MRETLIDLVLGEDSRVIAVVGLAKNTGKTTTLLYLVKHLEQRPEALALTSTGRDGEAIDEITRREKPRVTIVPGIVATTSERSFADSEGLFRVRDTRFITALGRIVVVGARRRTLVILEGPATAAETGELASTLIKEDRVRRVIIDGSLDRVAVATPDVSEGIVLATGAILGPDIDSVVTKTRHVAGLFMTRRTQCVSPNARGIARYFATSADGSEWEVTEGSAITDLRTLVDSLKRGKDFLFISGALSDGVIESLMAERLFPVVVVRDPTRLFISERSKAMFEAGGGRIEVEREIKVIALTINPHNPEGVDFSPLPFLDGMRAGIPNIPTFDIMREG